MLKWLILTALLALVAGWACSRVSYVHLPPTTTPLSLLVIPQQVMLGLGGSPASITIQVTTAQAPANRYLTVALLDPTGEVVRQSGWTLEGVESPVVHPMLVWSVSQPGRHRIVAKLIRPPNAPLLVETSLDVHGSAPEVLGVPPSP